MKTKLHRQSVSLKTDQSGMVSIMVSLVLMIVLSLVVLGFAQISRRNQRVTLDRQLSTQAFYAAESGVNDAVNAIKAAGKADPKTNCSPATSGIYNGISNVLNAANQVSYSCLLVDPTPPSLQYTTIKSSGTIVPIISASGANISKITLVWHSDAQSPLSGCSASFGVGSFLPATPSGWRCGYGVLRFDLVKANGNQSANGYQSNTMTTFAVPLSGGGGNQITFGPNANATTTVSCTANNCTLTIVGLNSNTYFMRVSSIYHDASNLIVTPSDAAGTALQTTSAQALIDSTGKAQDVLRRIQVRIPYNGSSSDNQLPMNGLGSTDSICKRFSIMPGWSSNSPGGVVGSNGLCN